jgi:hypothetical protein
MLQLELTIAALNPTAALRAVNIKVITAALWAQFWLWITHRNLLLLAHWEGSGYLLNGVMQMTGADPGMWTLYTSAKYARYRCRLLWRCGFT